MGDNKIHKLIAENVSPDIEVAVDTMTNKVVDSFDRLKAKVFSVVTADGYELEVGNTYNTIVKYALVNDKENKGKMTLDGDIFWAKAKLTQKDGYYYKYDIVDSDVSIEKKYGNILDDKENFKVIMSPMEKIPKGMINGFYLYGEKKDLKSILDEYKVKYNEEAIEKEKQEEQEAIDVKPGNVYQVKNSKGNLVDICVIDVKDDVVFGYDAENGIKYSHMKKDKLTHSKYVSTVYEYVKDKMASHKLSVWRNTSEFAKAKEEGKDAAVSYAKEKANSLRRYYYVLEEIYKNGHFSSQAEKGGIESLMKSIKNMISSIKTYVSRTYGIDIAKKKKQQKEKQEKKQKEPNRNPNKEKEPNTQSARKEEQEQETEKQKEPKEDRTETEEEKAAKEEVQQAEEKAKEVQTNIQQSGEEKEPQEKEQVTAQVEKHVIRSYKDFVNEAKRSKKKQPAHKPLEVMAGVRVNGVDMDFKVGDIVKFASDNYKSEPIKVADIYELGLYNDVGDKGDKYAVVDGKEIKVKDLTREQRKKVRKAIDDVVEIADLRYPIIVTVNRRGRYTGIIDGHHRLEKAHNKGKKLIRAYVIPEQDIIRHFGKEKGSNK